MGKRRMIFQRKPWRSTASMDGEAVHSAFEGGQCRFHHPSVRTVADKGTVRRQVFLEDFG